jgi:Ni/Co efflux regulator RcnB
MRRRAALSLFALLPAILAKPAAAQSAAQVLFSDLERQMIMDYYARQGASGGGGRGQGRGHGGGLPPGLQRHLDRGGSLPPGLARHGLPPGLAGQLPPPPSGYLRQIVGSDVVLVSIATGIIMDIIRGVVRE